MLCRAHFLLEKDFQELKENNYKGISAFPVSEDMMKWEAEIEGLQDTVWHGLPFQLTINFTSEYNFVPPVVKFRTIPFHPNVDLHTGRPCMDFLDNPDKWSTSYTLSSILLTLQVMLSNPVLENPVNLEAAQMLIKDESMYSLIVVRLFHQPIQLKDGSSELPKDPDKVIRSMKAVSFNDYYKTWSGIATSKATDHYRTPLLKDPDFVGEYNKWKKMELKHPKEWNLKCAAVVARLARENKRPYKASYPTGRTHLCPAPIQIFPDSQTEADILIGTDETEEGWKCESSPDDDNTNESWEKEVEDLVAWTNTLNTNTLED
ncbi:ubiquitin-conjugating enzyme E2 U isoform X1 [Diceros bicornis minor]|uniref:ubiquitin-conjugating enzyme E2 U isoform X1 n=1 Tax=Diceros bicornis minor TaxID=77932 RepID=UPI0026F06C92|nr:ubiquitin-conjugating enzyme E2 U isoform X1 [Diceros bicornis minor]